MVGRSVLIGDPESAEKRTLHIAFGVDEHYAPAMGVTILSLVEHNPSTGFIFHVLVSHLPPDDLTRLEQLARQLDVTIRVHTLESSGFAAIRDGQSLTYAAYFRLFIAPLLATETDRVLYLDCDLVCLREIPDFPDLAGHAIGAVLDIEQDVRNRTLGRAETIHYFNSGVMVIDTQRWNAIDLTSRTLDHLNRRSGLPYLDQDGLNLALADDFAVLDIQWNTFYDTFTAHPEHQETTIFLHYTGHKPWQAWCGHYLDHHFAQYLDRSPWPRQSLLRPPVKREHKRLYAQHLWQKEHWLLAALWYLRLLTTSTIVKKS